MTAKCIDAVDRIFICTNQTKIPFQNISIINLRCKEIKVPSLIVERLSDAFHLQPKTFLEGFSSVRRGSVLNCKLLTNFNPGAKRNNFYFKSTDRSQLHTVCAQAVHFYKLGLFESSHPVFCDYITVLSYYNKALATFAQEV